MVKSIANNNTKNKKTAWELIKEIPNTPEQRKIDREIAAIEKKYEKIRVKKLKSSKIMGNENREKIEYNNLYNIDDYGWNAGKIWNLLNIHGPLNQSSIIKNANLSINDFFIGIGWLARENKISKEIDFYKLGNTNLTNEIGENAGKIWKLLDSQGKTDISTITKLTEMKVEDIYLAIGWLSRENKIKFLCKDNQLIFELT